MNQYRIRQILCFLAVLAFLPWFSADAKAAPAVLTDYTSMEGYTVTEIASSAACVIELNTGSVLYAKDSHSAYAPASTLKILTALLAIENCDLSETVTFSARAVTDIEDGGNNYDFKEGETMSLRSAIEVMLLESVNEAAYAIAEHVGGSMESFVAMMNARAKELGAGNSNFVNPNGLNHESQYTTAEDLALILAECVRNPAFVEIASMQSCCVTDTTVRSGGFAYTNHYKMVLPDSEFYREYVVCGKTGYTSLAGNTLVTYASKDGLDLAVVILKANGYEDAYNDTVALCEYVFSNYRMAPVGEYADNVIFEELGPCETSYGASGILIADWDTKSEVTATVTGLTQKDGNSYEGRVAIQVGNREEIVSTVTALSLTRVFYASDFPALASQSAEPTADIPEETQEETEHQANERNILLLCINAAASCVLAVCIVYTIVLQRRLRKALVQQKKEEAALRK